MVLENGAVFGGTTGANGAGLRRADIPVMTVSRETFLFSRYISNNSDLLIGMQPAVINPHEELVIKVSKDIHSVDDVIALMQSIQMPDGMNLTFAPIYETIDFVAEFDNFSDMYQPRLRMAFINGEFRDMRYLFAEQNENSVSWAGALEARVENVIAIMRKYSDQIAADQKVFNYMTVLRFFNPHCRISQIIHKINCDVSFGEEFNRVFAEAGYRDETGTKIAITDTHRISSVNHFMKAVISQSHRSKLSPSIDHEYGIGTAISLLNGKVKPTDVIRAYTPTSEPSIGVDVELRGGDDYRKIASGIAWQIIAATKSTEFGALARKGNVAA